MFNIRLYEKMNSSTTRKIRTGLLSGLCLYLLSYIVCSFLGSYSWIYGSETSKTGVGLQWDGVDYVPLFFACDQNHLVNQLYRPLLELDRRYVHNNVLEALEREVKQIQNEPASSGDDANRTAPEK
jgi:hypothetical protein